MNKVYKRAYTCSQCKKHWNKDSTEKRHNKRTCKEQKNELQEQKNEEKKQKIEEKKVKIEGDCNICFDDCCDFKTKCGHTYCTSCIKTWCDSFENKTTDPTCPICREKIHKDDLIKMKAKKKRVQRRQEVEPRVTLLIQSLLGTSWQVYMHHRQNMRFYWNPDSETAQWDFPYEIYDQIDFRLH